MRIAIGQCLAELCETAVPVVLDGNAIAFLVLHPMLHRRPTKKAFSSALRRLRQRGIAYGIKNLEASYLASPVMSASKREAIVSLLATFADHLALHARELGSS